MTADDPFDRFHKLQEKLRAAMDPAALERVRETNEKLRETMGPLMDRTRAQNAELARKLAPALKQTREDQAKLNETLLPAFRTGRAHQESLAKTFEPAMRQLHEQNERVAKVLSEPLLEQMREQQDRLREILSGPALGEVLDYQERLAARLVDYATELPVDEVDLIVEDAVEGPARWFGARSWQFVTWEVEGLLKTLELLTASMYLANTAMADQPFPEPWLAVLLMLVVAGELAVWFATRPD